MQFSKRWLVVVLLLVSLQLAGCGKATEGVVAEEAGPAKVEHLTNGPDATKIVLTEDAAKRIDLQTVKVAAASGGAKGVAIPYAAVLYDTEGKTWTYTNADPLTFVRSPIAIDHMDGDMAVLKAGPAVGTPVVTVGAAELFGSESEFEEE
ncbi:MAG: hypothetical protein U0350_18645 [Caldilineaceae bacterium]